MFISTCGHNAFTIRGLCAICAPELHAQDKIFSEFMDRHIDKFKQETGKLALADWDAFERYLARQLADERTAMEALKFMNRSKPYINTMPPIICKKHKREDCEECQPK